MVVIFDGGEFAKKMEEELREVVEDVGKKKLVIFWVGDDRSSEIYVKKKKEMGERIGVDVEVKRVGVEELVEGIKMVCADKKIDGVMVQLPIPGLSKEEERRVLDLIAVSKDVDGLTSENLRLIETGEQIFVPATVKAVGKIVDEAIREVGLDIERMRVAVVGSIGNVGRPLVNQLKRFGFEVGEFEKNDDLSGLREFDVVVSCVGEAGLIQKDMVKGGVVAIDVGFPSGDFDTRVREKASFLTPVPGGVGPVTVACLMENVVSGGSI